MQFMVMSREDARAFTYSNELNKPTIIISISNTNEEPNIFNKGNENIINILYLQFDDNERGEPNCMTREDAEKIFGCWNGKVIGEFVCDEIYTIDCDSTGFFYKGKQGYVKKELEYNSCLLEGNIFSYLFPNVGYSWHISELKIYDEPKELYSFVKPCDREYDCCVCMRWDNSVQNCEDSIINPPKSWCYVDELR